MTDIFNRDYHPVNAHEIEEVEFDDFNLFLEAMGTKYGERGAGYAHVVLWTRMGIPQRLNALGLDECSAVIYADCMLSRLMSNIFGLTQGQLHEVFTEFGYNELALTLSPEMQGKICYGFELLGSRIEGMALTTPDGEQLWGYLNDIDEMIDAISNGLRDSLEYNPFYGEEYCTRVRRYLTPVNGKIH